MLSLPGEGDDQEPEQVEVSIVRRARESRCPCAPITATSPPSAWNASHPEAAGPCCRSSAGSRAPASRSDRSPRRRRSLVPSAESRSADQKTGAGWRYWTIKPCEGKVTATAASFDPVVVAQTEPASDGCTSAVLGRTSGVPHAAEAAARVVCLPIVQRMRKGRTPNRGIRAKPDRRRRRPGLVEDKNRAKRGRDCHDG